MTRPLRARYGARDNMHALLDWEGHPARLPADLLGLTDKPPGSYAPRDRWWPSVGCGPVEDWWALWWTQPDEQARRGGMVRSEVALWRLDEVEGADDLRPIMELLGGRRPIPMPSTDLLGVLAEAMLSPDTGRPVLPDLDMWPGVIAALWSRLWAEARRVFSARVAVSPPQGGESVTPPWIFGVPPDRVLQWAGHRVIAVAPGPTRLSRAARWLVGEKDPTLDEVRNACPLLPAELGVLPRMARAADRLDRLREAPEPQRALEVLRTLLALAPDPEAAAGLKNEALRVLERGLADGPATIVRALANIDRSHLPATGLLESALDAWMARNAPELPLEDASGLMEMLSPDRAKGWWQDVVRSGLAAGLENPEPRWAKAALHWLGLSKPAEVLRDLLPATEVVEHRLLIVSPEVKLAEASLHRLRSEAVQRGWSRLHAWVAMQALSPREALQEQQAFPGDPAPGLAFLVKRLPGSTVVEEAVTRADPRLTTFVAQRTAREPELLSPLDAGSTGWRALWAAHVRAQGPCWPPGVDHEALGRGLLAAVLTGDEPDGLIASLAADLASVALDHPQRAGLWGAMSPTGRAALLPHVAEALVRCCEQGQVVRPVEAELREAVVRQARRTRPSPQVCVALLEWNANIDEQEAIRWLNYHSRMDWAPLANALGRAVLRRGWKNMALEIYCRWKYHAEFLPALDACQELLPRWERFLLSLRGMSGTSGRADDAPIINRVAEVGASIAWDRLEDLWERAGGERKRLKTDGAADVRWREAATLAHLGALKGGALALVEALLADFPHNKDLEELKKVLVDRR